MLGVSSRSCGATPNCLFCAQALKAWASGQALALFIIKPVSSAFSQLPWSPMQLLIWPLCLNQPTSVSQLSRWIFVFTDYFIPKCARKGGRWRHWDRVANASRAWGNNILFPTASKTWRRLEKSGALTTAYGFHRRKTDEWCLGVSLKEPVT